MNQKLNKKKREVEVLLENVTVENEHASGSESSGVRIEDSFISLPQMDSHVESTWMKGC